VTDYYDDMEPGSYAADHAIGADGPPPIITSAALDLPFAWMAVQTIEQAAAQMRLDMESCMRAESFGDARNVGLIDAGRRTMQRALDALDYGQDYAALKYDQPEDGQA
jgi:hypothetical protein